MSRVWNLLYTPDSLEYSRPPDLANSGQGLVLSENPPESKNYGWELGWARPEIHLVREVRNGWVSPVLKAELGQRFT